tara:strand:+ start:633 stop:1256 length:624 start_codon:yes stop_codon:yes gene_type:complete
MMDFKKYEFTLNCDNPDWTTDKRHVAIIYEFLMRADVKRVAELGSYTGFSTAAFIEALNNGKDFKLHLSEPRPTPQLKTVISMCKKPDNVVLHTQCGVNFLEVWKDFDLVFVDADHSMVGAGADLLMLLKNEIRNVMAHDTNLNSMISNYDGMGTELLGRVLKIHPDYKVIEDKEKRKNEFTERGFLFASMDDDNYNIAKGVFEDLC